MIAHIVLGLGFGDEGKGSMVDYLVSKQKQNSIVIRFSGGQQCGHTVIRNGIKHVFSNCGSGSLQNVPTYFSEHTSIYLNTLFNEKKLLNEKGIDPVLYVHPLTKLTTPYDVAYNRLNARKKGHVSCGLGIGTTMNRSLTTPYKLYAIDSNNKNFFFERLKVIKNYYLSLFEGNPIEINAFLLECVEHEKEFIGTIDEKLFEIKNYDFLKGFENLIFEGSQGIMLDMDHGIFPYVTYANTTSKNAIEICNKLNLSDIDRRNFIYNTYYVTRCYQTRHGEGWMSNEKELNLVNNNEEINILNEYQGNFRIGEIDYDLLNQSILIDQIYNKSIDFNLVITCLDHRPNFKFDYGKIKNIERFGVYNSESPIGEKIFIERY